MVTLGYRVQGLYAFGLTKGLGFGDIPYPLKKPEHRSMEPFICNFSTIFQAQGRTKQSNPTAMLGVPIMRILILRGLCGGSPIMETTMWGLQSKVFRGWQMSSRKASCQRSCRYNRYGKTQCGLHVPGAEEEKRKRRKVCA